MSDLFNSERLTKFIDTNISITSGKFSQVKVTLVLKLSDANKIFTHAVFQLALLSGAIDHDWDVTS